MLSKRIGVLCVSNILKLSLDVSYRLQLTSAKGSYQSSVTTFLQGGISDLPYRIYPKKRHNQDSIGHSIKGSKRLKGSSQMLFGLSMTSL